MRFVTLLVVTGFLGTALLVGCSDNQVVTADRATRQAASASHEAHNRLAIFPVYLGDEDLSLMRDITHDSIASAINTAGIFRPVFASSSYFQSKFQAESISRDLSDIWTPQTYGGRPEVDRVVQIGTLIGVDAVLMVSVQGV